MIFHKTEIPGVMLIDPEPHGDERGFFQRIFCQREFDDAGINSNVVNVNNSLSQNKGTLRGLHYQLPPSMETKLVRCTRGSLYDVALDLRQDSPTFGRHIGVELDAQSRRMIFIPQGCAHGIQTLENDTEILYMVSAFYDPENERGVRWNDPKFNVAWPLEPTVMSEKDQAHPDFDPGYHLW